MSHTVRRRKSHKAWAKGMKSRAPIECAANTQPAPRRAPTKSEREHLVTDHAVLRWLERVTGVDVAQQVRDEILAEGRDQVIPKVNFGKIRIADSNVVLQIVQGRVVTVKLRISEGTA